MSDDNRAAGPTFSYLPHPTRDFNDATEAVDYITQIYHQNTQFLRNAFLHYAEGKAITGRARA